MKQAIRFVVDVAMFVPLAFQAMVVLRGRGFGDLP